ncbi:MAG: AbrB/MazE/SpoVT family DNA-binding domain-containing protein [Anaerolineaceae bacterium]
MRRKIFKTGNSLVVSIPKELLEPLGMRDGSNVSVELDRKKRQIMIREAGHPISPDINESFSRQVDEFIEEYRSALEALAR